MAEQNKTEEEPSIEEILASIRQIISDDDAEASPSEAPEEEAAEPEAASEPEPEPEPLPEPEPKREPDAVLPPMEDFTDEALFTRSVESSAYAAISELASRASVERHGGLTIEDVVRDELRPMLRAWLDKNLPPLIERLVQDELERVTKRVLGDMGE